MFNNKVIFITGGTGTWGQAIVKDLLKNYDVKKIIIFSRSEDKQVRMERNFNNKKLKFIIGDIRNYSLLLNSIKGSDYVIHLAALKHISKCEYNPYEAISININGTQNIIEASIECKVSKVLYISTDKAADPYNLYGNTKAIGENLFINANNYDYNNGTCFFSLRTGNIFGSSGSVVEVFYNQLINDLPITITNYSMKRFYIEIDFVVEKLSYIFNKSIGGEIFILKGDIFSIKELVDGMSIILKKSIKDVIQLGKNISEKENETLVSKNEIEKTFILSDDIFVIDILSNHKNLEKVKFSEYSTNSINLKNSNKNIKDYLLKFLKYE